MNRYDNESFLFQTKPPENKLVIVVSVISCTGSLFFVICPITILHYDTFAYSLTSFIFILFSLFII